jgi:hypothetical protein
MMKKIWIVVALIVIFGTAIVCHFIWHEHRTNFGSFSDSEIFKSSFSISQNGRHFSYCVFEGGAWYVVLDGTRGQKTDGILKGTPVFSSNGKVCLYVAKMGSKSVLVKNNVPIYEPGEISGSINVGADGSQVLCVARCIEADYCSQWQ